MARPAVRSDRSESGVVALVVALVTCLVLVPVAALAVDIGMQRVARRDMQAVADVVALDVARQLDGRTWSQLHGHLQQWGDRSAARNSGAAAAPVVSVELGRVDPAAYDPADPDAWFVPITSDAGGVPSAVRVTAVGSVDFSFYGGSGGVVRTAIARSQSSACFRLGSYALSLNSQNSPLLNALIGDALDVSAISYTGLADANVSLLGLAAELGAGTTDELLALDDLSLNQLYLASAHVLQKQGGDTADVALLNQLATLGLGALPHVAFGDLIALQPGNDAALSTSVNLLDLVAASAFVANGTHALALPNVSIGVPGLASVTGSLRVIEAPQEACGVADQATAHTAQITLDLTVKLAPLNLLSILLLGTVTADATVTLHVELAAATGTLRKVQCAPGQPDGIDVEVASALSEIGLSLPINVKLLGIPVVSITGGVGTTAPAANATVQIRLPPTSYDAPVSTGTGTVLPGLTIGNLHAVLLGAIDLSPILAAVSDAVLTPIVNPLVANLNSLLLEPLTDLLGANVAGADVFAVKAPTCGTSTLVG
jgi:uncharacterized membrane protein